MVKYSRSFGRSSCSARVLRNGASRTTSGPEGSSVKRDPSCAARAPGGCGSTFQREFAEEAVACCTCNGLLIFIERKRLHALHRTLSQMAAAHVLGPRRPGAYLAHALAGHHIGPHRPCVSLLRPARHGQDEHGEDPRDGAELRASAGRGAVREVRELPPHHGRVGHGRLRDRRRVKPRHRRDPRPP